MKDDEHFGLLKIPDEIVIRELRVELGKANARIAELEYELNEVKSATVSDLCNQIKSLKGTIKTLVNERKQDSYYTLYKNQKKENDMLRQEISVHVGKIYQLKKSLNNKI